MASGFPGGIPGPHPAQQKDAADAGAQACQEGNREVAQNGELVGHITVGCENRHEHIHGRGCPREGADHEDDDAKQLHRALGLGKIYDGHGRVKGNKRQEEDQSGWIEFFRGLAVLGEGKINPGDYVDG